MCVSNKRCKLLLLHTCSQHITIILFQYNRQHIIITTNRRCACCHVSVVHLTQSFCPWVVIDVFCYFCVVIILQLLIGWMFQYNTQHITVDWLNVSVQHTTYHSWLAECFSTTHNISQLIGWMFQYNTQHIMVDWLNVSVQHTAYHGWSVECFSTTHSISRLIG